MRSSLAWGALAIIVGAACEDDVVVPPPGAGGTGGEGGTETCTVSLIYDPASGALDAFPDDTFTVDDPTSATGVRVHTVDGDNLVVPPEAQQFALVFEDLSTLDGFGTTSAIYLRLTGGIDPESVPSPEESISADASVLLVHLDGGELVPFEVETVVDADGDPATTLVVSPLAPLRPRSRYGLFVSRDLRAEDGGCIARSEAMEALLAGTTTDARLGERYDALGDALALLGRSRDEAVAALVFTTQHTVEDSAAIAETIRGTAVSYTAIDNCTDPDPLGAFLLCEGEVTASDFRKEGRFVDESDLTPQASYALSISTYLPKNATAPHPTILFGHGLGGDRHQAEALAEFAAPTGYAVVSIDAVKHGDHPDQPEAGLPIGDVISFFGLSLGADPVDGLRLRDNWRQSTYDKLHVIEMLRAGVDVDGDASVDITTDELMYIGVSLGGIMSAELLALAPDIDVAVPIVPGARVANIIKDGAQFEIVINLLAGMATQGQIARFFPLLQTIIDRGDAGAYLAHVIDERLPGLDAQSPQVLMQMVLNDDTVPNSTNLFFARGLRVPHVGEALLPIGVIPHEPDLPVTANVDADHTAGVFQFDIVFDGSAATHSNIGRDLVSQEQTLHFIETFYSSGVAEIIDSYVTLGIK